MIEYNNWDKSFGVSLSEDGTMYTTCGCGLSWHEKEYNGDGLPAVCQAVRQKLLLGTLNTDERRQINDDDILFGIKGINHSYYDWTCDIFEDYDIDILQGSKEDVRKIFDDCVIGCDQCCGCGDW